MTSPSFFFFQAEDGIRDYKVTGVQTCALPAISRTDPDPSPPRKTPAGRAGRSSCGADLQVSASAADALCMNWPASTPAAGLESRPTTQMLRRGIQQQPERVAARVQRNQVRLTVASEVAGGELGKTRVAARNGILLRLRGESAVAVPEQDRSNPDRLVNVRDQIEKAVAVQVRRQKRRDNGATLHERRAERSVPVPQIDCDGAIKSHGNVGLPVAVKVRDDRAASCVVQRHGRAESSVTVAKQDVDTPALVLHESPGHDQIEVPVPVQVRGGDGRGLVNRIDRCRLESAVAIAQQDRYAAAARGDDVRLAVMIDVRDSQRGATQRAGADDRRLEGAVAVAQ